MGVSAYAIVILVYGDMICMYYTYRYSKRIRLCNMMWYDDENWSVGDYKKPEIIKFNKNLDDHA